MATTKTQRTDDAITFDRLSDALTVGWDGEKQTLGDGLAAALLAATNAAERTGKKSTVTVRFVVEPLEPGEIEIAAELSAKIPQPRPTAVLVRTHEDPEQGTLFEIIPQAEAA